MRPLLVHATAICVSSVLLSACATLNRKETLTTPPSDHRIIILDLGDPTVNQTVSPGSYGFRMLNRLPKHQYKIELVKETIPLPPIDSIPHVNRMNPILFANDQCEVPLQALEKILDDHSNESTLDNVFGTWRAANRTCSQDGDRVFARLTQKTLQEVVTIRANQRVRVKVTRGTAGDTASWTFVASTDPRGEWRTSYGFTFLPELGARYFAKQRTDTTTKFTITKEDDHSSGFLDSNLNFTPSILFTWFPMHASDQDWSPGLTAGVGHDFSKLSVLGGLALSYNQNVTLTFGAAVQERPILLGKYKNGETILTDLDREQLHENRLRPNFYFGVAFRLGSNPFQQREVEESGSAPTPEDQAAAPGSQDGGAPTNMEFEPTSIKKGDKIGPWTVSDVSNKADSTVVKITGDFKEVAGKASKADLGGASYPCLSLADTEAAQFPTPKGSEPSLVCFREDAKGADQIAEGTDITATFNELVIAIPGAGEVVVTAKLLEKPKTR